MSSAPLDRETSGGRAGNSQSEEQDDAKSPQTQTALQYRPLKPRPAQAPTTGKPTQHGKRPRMPGQAPEPQPRRIRRNEFAPLLPAGSAPVTSQNTARRVKDALHANDPATSRTLLFAASSDPGTGPSAPTVHFAPTPGWSSAPGSSTQSTTPTQSRPLRQRQYVPFWHSREHAPEQQTQFKPSLLGLPVETRYRIYQLLLVENSRLLLSTRKKTRTLEVPALLHVNRQVREEAGHVWYGLNDFVLVVKHGETTLVKDFLTAVANIRTPTSIRLEIRLSTCFQCNDLIGVAALLISCNINARIKCVRSMYHVGDTQVMPCRFNVAQAIMDQNFRPSVATALLKSSNQQVLGAGFVVEEHPSDSIMSHSSSSTAARESAVLGYTPTYHVNMGIRTHLENSMGSVGLLLQ